MLQHKEISSKKKLLQRTKPQRSMDVMERKHGMDMYLLGHRKKMNTRHYLII